MDTIRLENMVFYGYHGVKSEESALGARFEVDVQLQTNLQPAVESDRLADTVNYNDVYELVEHQVTERKCYLLETLAGTICERVLNEFPGVSSVLVRVRKPNAPIEGVLDYVEVEIERERSHEE